ncbi:MAG: MFS transporter [Polyangiaceae bacterium]|nr:MFS transporter [Polyangiaceae bacterium]
MPFIMIAVLIDMLSIGLIVPVLPLLVGEFTQSKADQSFWYGAVAFAFGIANFFASPVLGALSDSYGRRPVMLLGFFALGLTFFGTALATELWMLILARLVGGAMQANVSVANAYVADITPAEERARRFGMLGAMFGIGFVLGPVLGGLLGALRLDLPFFVAGSLALANLVYGYFVVPESLPPSERRAFSWSRATPLASLRSLARLRGVGGLVAVIACTGLAQFTTYTTWVLYSSFKFGWGPRENGWALAAFGVSSGVAQGLFLGRLLRRWSPRQLAVAGLASSSVAYAAFGAVTQGWMMFVVIALNLLGTTVAANIQSIISGAASAQNQGQTLGAVSSLNSLMAVLAPTLAGPMMALVSHYPRGDWRMGAPFYFCALLQALGLVLAVRHFRRANLELAALPKGLS